MVALYSMVVAISESVVGADRLIDDGKVRPQIQTRVLTSAQGSSDLMRHYSLNAWYLRPCAEEELPARWERPLLSSPPKLDHGASSPTVFRSSRSHFSKAARFS